MVYYHYNFYTCMYFTKLVLAYFRRSILNLCHPLVYYDCCNLNVNTWKHIIIICRHFETTNSQKFLI